MPDPSGPPVATSPGYAVDSGPVAPGRTRDPDGRWTGRFAPLRVLVVLIVVAAVATGWLLTRPTGPAYRTVTVASGTAVATLSAVGTITPVQQADLAFAAAGTVGTVDVTVGQHVTAGQVVATLDPTSLQSAVVVAEADLASAQATLATDETTQAGGTATTTSTTSTNSSTGSGSGTGGGGTTNSSASAGGTVGGSANPAVTKLQAALVADQHQEDAAAAAAGSALQAATTACTTGSSAGAVNGQAPAASGPPPGGSGGGGQMTCSQALAAASTAHQALVTAIDKVTKDEAALASALGLGGSSGSGGSGGGGGSGGAGAGSPGSGGTPTTTSTTYPTTTTTTAPGGSATGSTTATTSRSASAGSSSSTGSRTRTVTPELIALDQATVDVAQAALTGAQRAAGQSNLVSTIAGTVGSVGVVPGQTVGAGSPSSTPQVVVVGSGSDYEVTTTVPVTKIQQVAVGQQALVTPDSSSTVLTGTVSAIGVLGTSTTTSTTYPVTIAFQSPDLGPFSGAESSIQIVTARASGVTTVPSSAVRTVGINHLVTMMESGKSTSVRVTVGTVGSIRTQILSGVHVGEVVSLASMDAPVPTSSTTTRGGLAGLAGSGGLGGAGGLGAGGASTGGFSRAARG